MWHERKLQGALHAEGSRPDQMRKEGGERGEGMAGGEGERGKGGLHATDRGGRTGIHQTGTILPFANRVR